MVRGLAQKLILSTTVIVILVLAAFGFLNARQQQRQILNSMILGADQLSKGITSATWHAMLADNRESAYQVMQTIAEKQGIDRISLYNREGRVVFSTRPEEEGRQVGRTSSTCSGCHGFPEPRVQLDQASRARIVNGASGRQSLEMVTPIYNEPACSQAACHAHPASIKVLGVLDLALSLEPVRDSERNAELRIFAMAATQVLLLMVLIVFFVRHFVSRPVRKLVEATKAVSAMNLDQPIPVLDSSREVGELARSFETMRQRLRTAMAENNEFTQRLEAKVEQRTQELKAAHQKLLQSDRLASLGQLSASVAHEINNPISGVLNLSMLLQRLLRDDGIPKERLPEFRKYLGQVVQETSRVGRIVSDLLAFSRRSKSQRSKADLNRIVRSTLSLVDHKLRLSNLRAEVVLDENLPQVFCDASQMQQVVLNLVLNAAESTHGKEGGWVRVETAPGPGPGNLTLSVSDNGEGIPAENLDKIFDPFFTTKPEGKGVGLGLAVLYGIVQSHGGDVVVESTPGAGTRFKVTLPVGPESAER
jgi:two-component system NtrC family sensor kinase